MPNYRLTDTQRLEFIKDTLRRLRNTQIAAKYDLPVAHSHSMAGQRWSQKALAYYQPLFDCLLDSLLDSLVTDLEPVSSGSNEAKLTETAQLIKDKIDNMCNTSL